MTSITTIVTHRIRTTGLEHQGQNSISDPHQNLGLACFFHQVCKKMHLSCLFFFFFLIESELGIVILIEMTNVIVPIANRIQKPPGGAGFCWRWVKMEHGDTNPYFM